MKTRWQTFYNRRPVDLPKPKERIPKNKFRGHKKKVWMQQRAAEMRKSPSWLEEKMIAKLSALGVYFKFQKVFGDYILDFYLPEVNLNIETDGAAFHKDKAKDKLRDRTLRKKGIRVVRFQFWQFEKNPCFIEHRIMEFFNQRDKLTEEYKRVVGI